MDLRDFTFGIEIETVKQTREVVAKAIQSVVGGWASYEGFPNCYDPWHIFARDGRVWKVMADSSLSSVPKELQAEVVSPILKYQDMEMLQEVIRAVRACGAKVCSQTGIHIHIGAAPFDGHSLGNLAKIVYKQEPLIYKALGIKANREQAWTKPVKKELIDSIIANKPKTKDDFQPLWYETPNPHIHHYHSSRYHGLNLHNVWFRGTVEFRWFNATLHAGKVKAYIQLCLALAAKAVNARSAQSQKRTYNPESAKYDFRVVLLGLGMIGDEFKTARLHLLAKLPGDSAFKRTRRDQALAA